MEKSLSKIGGRRFLIAVLCMTIIALSKQLGLDEQSIKWIVSIAGGGIGGIAIEDAIKAVKTK